MRLLASVHTTIINNNKRLQHCFLKKAVLVIQCVQGGVCKSQCNFKTELFEFIASAIGRDRPLNRAYRCLFTFADALFYPTLEI